MTAALRPMRWRDIDVVHALEQELFADDAWSVELFWSELAQHAARRYVVAAADAHIVGYAGLAAYGEDGYVQTIAVAPAAQRRGIGTLLLDDLLSDAQRRGVRSVALEVRTDNTTAQALYARFGFAPVGLRRGYYQPSGADALVMVVDGLSDYRGLSPSPAARRASRVTS